MMENRAHQQSLDSPSPAREFAAMYEAAVVNPIALLRFFGARLNRFISVFHVDFAIRLQFIVRCAALWFR
jgi:hypothetical protein